MKLVVTNDGDGIPTVMVGSQALGFVQSKTTREFDVPQYYKIRNYDINGAILEEPTFDVTVNSLIYIASNKQILPWGLPYTGIASTVTVPIIGTVTLPTWATRNPDAAVFFIGFSIACGIRIFRSGNRWMKRAAEDNHV